MGLEPRPIQARVLYGLVHRPKRQTPALAASLGRCGTVCTPPPPLVPARKLSRFNSPYPQPPPEPYPSPKGTGP
ncbi:hypothetical protein TIFTF001_024425 [Ficus carica]|uniref:Uncharacterized protein n=1 Tax=Ficus carica TaxID=3494 RepID=A0AA88AGP1_FICCA|nr:hypothetical protein TIFTF001_024425 [Ficus carica]